MGQWTQGAIRAFNCQANIGVHARVKLSAGLLVLAGANDISIGTIQENAFASETYGALPSAKPVLLRTAQGTKKMIAAGAIAAGALVYSAANGQVAAMGPIVEGQALEAATNAGDVIEVLPLPTTGMRVVAGQWTTLSAADTIVTGLSQVVCVMVSFDSDISTADEFVSATIGNQSGAPAAGSVIIKSWQSTGAAAAVFGKNVNWIAVGY